MLRCVAGIEDVADLVGLDAATLVNKPQLPVHVAFLNRLVKKYNPQPAVQEGVCKSLNDLVS